MKNDNYSFKILSSSLVMLQLFLLPAAQISYAQVSPTQQAEKIQKPATLSRLHIITPAHSTLLVENGKQEALLISDNLSSTRLIEKIDGTSAISQRYFPYGQTQDTENTITDKQFTSHRNIADAGVYHAGARFYAPQMGLFVQADKVEGPNRYAYVNGNPISNTDPTGNVVCTYCKDLPGVGRINTGGRFPDEPAPIHDASSFVKANVANVLAAVGVISFLPSSSLDNYVTDQHVKTSLILATSPAAGMVGGATDEATNAVASSGFVLSGPSFAPNVTAPVRKLGLFDKLGKVIGSGTFGKVIAVNDRIVRKLFHGVKQAGIDEIDDMSRYGGGLLPEVRAVLTNGKGQYVGYEMDRINGVTLAQYDGPVIPEDIIRRAVQELGDLEFRGFRHGDIKSNNVMIELDAARSPTGVRLIDPYRQAAERNYNVYEGGILNDLLRGYNNSQVPR